MEGGSRHFMQNVCWIVLFGELFDVNIAIIASLITTTPGVSAIAVRLIDHYVLHNPLMDATSIAVFKFIVRLQFERKINLV